jgi:hypothetical protein
MSRSCLPWSLLGAWLAAVALVAPSGAEEFSFTRCIATGSGSDSARSATPRPFDGTSTREFACLKTQREYEAKRQAKEAAERERQRRAEEEATRRQTEAQAKETADQAAKAKSRARQEGERARKAEEVDAARQRGARQETERAHRAVQQRPGAEQFMPGVCPTPDLTAKCAMPQDSELEQIWKFKESAPKGRPNR